VIQAIDATQSSPSLPSRPSAQIPPSPSPESSNPDSEILDPNSSVPLLTPEEKRRILARIARVNPLDCFDESGDFDLARAKRVLPPGMVRHIAIHETTRLNAEGQPVTQRRISVRLVDPVSALRLDDLLERRRESTASHSHSTSKNFTRRDFNLLTEKTMALEDANHSIERLKKALAEADDLELQLSKELDEKDRQLSQTLSPSNGSETLSKVEGDAVQRDTGCQPVHKMADSSAGRQSETSNSSNVPSKAPRSSSMALQSQDQSPEAGFSTPLSPCSSVSGTPQLFSAEGQPLSSAEGDTLSEAERIAKKRRESAARSLEREIEHVRNTSGHGGFTRWLRKRGLDPANYPPPPLPTKPHAARPPP